MATKRKNFYENNIEPHLDEIRKAVSLGATVEEIANGLGISQSALYNARKKHDELEEAFTSGRQKVIIEIKNALLKKALGFYYDEQRTYITEQENGKKKKHIETYHRYSVPSETAGAMMLRNIDKTWKDHDEITMTLKQQELELRKKIAEADKMLDFGDL